MQVATGMRCWAIRAALAALFLVGCTAATWGQISAPIVRVEQDWELIVEAPDSDNDAPQAVTVISPVGDALSVYAAFELNQRAEPSGFMPGGLQLQVWDGETLVAEQSYARDNILDEANETITWTQKMLLADGHLVFKVTDCISHTWGDFGDDGNLRLSVDTTLTTLAGYGANVSVVNSGVGYGGNGVRSLILKRTRLYTEAGLLSEDCTEKVVHTNQ